ncbi:MAG: hypothetical protein Q8K52_01865 [Thiobacillus sp.]|nr:hypothetical protein [Thiobacillus sp.]
MMRFVIFERPSAQELPRQLFVSHDEKDWCATKHVIANRYPKIWLKALGHIVLCNEVACDAQRVVLRRAMTMAAPARRWRPVRSNKGFGVRITADSKLWTPQPTALAR